MISFRLEEEEQMVHDTARDFARNELRPKLRDFEHEGVPAALRRQFAELGFTGLDLAADSGGQGMPAIAAAVAHEELAYGDPAAAAALGVSLGAFYTVEALAPAEKRAAILAPYLGGETSTWTMALAFSERGNAPAPGFAATARRDGPDYILTGEKLYVQGAPGAHEYVVAANAGAGWDATAFFVVPAAVPGLEARSLGRTLGLNAVPVGAVKLTDVRVPASARLDSASPATTREALTRAFARMQLINAAHCVGLARAAFDYALEWSQQRVAFGKVIAHFQAPAFMLADMATAVEASRWMTYRAAWALSQNHEDWLESIHAAASHARETALRVANDGVQLLGGAGFIQDNPSEKWLRDAKQLALSGGADVTSLHAIAAHNLGTPPAFDAGLPVPDGNAVII